LSDEISRLAIKNARIFKLVSRQKSALKYPGWHWIAAPVFLQKQPALDGCITGSLQREGLVPDKEVYQ
jgi:hypothetical protein